MTNSPPDDRLTALETAFADYRVENDRKLDRLQLLAVELLELARIHQQTLQVHQARYEESDRRIEEILEYLRGRSPNGGSGS